MVVSRSFTSHQRLEKPNSSPSTFSHPPTPPRDETGPGPFGPFPSPLSLCFCSENRTEEEPHRVCILNTVWQYLYNKIIIIPKFNLNITGKQCPFVGKFYRKKNPCCLFLCLSSQLREPPPKGIIRSAFQPRSRCSKFTSTRVPRPRRNYFSLTIG